MASNSRWANDEEDAEVEAQRKREKEERKRAKAEKQRKNEEVEQQRLKAEDAKAAHVGLDAQEDGDQYSRPAKRRKVTPETSNIVVEESLDQTNKRSLLRYNAPQWYPCRNVSNFERLNDIEEGSYGWVSRAKETATGEVVALKKLKMEGNDTQGFPVTGLREIQCLMESRHRHVVELREVVMGNSLTEVFLVMEFLEHDLKTLQEEMQEPFAPSETKTLMLQLASAVDYLHDHWILHRDLKTSNILMSNRGEIKLADFGMARKFGDPPPKMTQLVVTLWYRAPELLLGAENYDQAIDMWSFGCIFGELLGQKPLLQGKNEVDELFKIFELCGIPNEENWPKFRRLPNAKSLKLPPRTQHDVGSVIRTRFPFLSGTGAALLVSLLSLNPAKRPRAKDVLNHEYFQESPKPKPTALFPTFPSKAGLERKRRHASPSAPKRGHAPEIHGENADFSGIFASRESEASGGGFQLKLG